MRFITLGRQLRMLRIRRQWRQRDVAARIGLSPSVVARQERGMITSLALLDRHAAALDLRLDLRLIGRTGQPVLLADEEHAAIVEAVAAWLRAAGFRAEMEASFSEWGERGRIDLLAYDPETTTAVIVEAKTLLLDLQDLLGALNVKERLLPSIARRYGWSLGRQITVLAVAGTAMNRTAVSAHPNLFASFAVRRLGQPALLAGGRILAWITPERTDRGAWIAGRQRVRPTSYGS